ncbi:DUF2752 domain-containing protein [Fulvivirga sp. RKSG066]|nr:DUF2752 domain-containing protein [Fulvivirga aurantia]
MTYLWKTREALIWLVALLVLAILDPTRSHISICPLSLLALDFCPGCGLGHSIGYLFRGEFLLSFKTHPLGAVAVVLLLYRSASLLYKNYKLK